MEGILNSWAWGWEHTSPLRSFLEPFCRGHNEDPPKDVHILIAGTYNSVTLHAKGTWQLRVVRWGLSSGHNTITWVFSRGRQEVRSQTRKCNIRSWDQSDMIAGFDNRKGSWAKECGRSSEAAKGKETISSSAPRRNTALPISWFYPKETCFGYLSLRTVRE